MKKSVFLIIAVFFFISCEKNMVDESDAKLISHSTCKYDKLSFFDNSESCVEYSYSVDSKTLNLKHINTAFNCCPEKLYFDLRY